MPVGDLREGAVNIEVSEGFIYAIALIDDIEMKIGGELTQIHEEAAGFCSSDIAEAWF